jgi:hypothetical protein
VSVARSALERVVEEISPNNKKGDTDHKNSPAGFLRVRLVGSEPVSSKIAASSSLATALPEGARARGLLRPRHSEPITTQGVNS